MQKKTQQIDFHINGRYRSINLDEIKSITIEALASFGIENFFIEIDIVSEKEIKKLNRESRKIDLPTDILSFPQISVPSTTKTRFLGTLVLNPETITSKNENIEDVVKHGILHLLNYDHELNEEEWSEAAEKIKCNL